MAPTLLASGVVGTKNQTAQNPTVTIGATGSAGDVLVVKAVQETGWTTGVPTASSSQGAVTLTTNPIGSTYTGLAVGAQVLTGSITTITLTRNANDNGKVVSCYYEIWTTANGSAGGTATNTTATGAGKTASYTTTAANSVISEIGGDFAAAATSPSLDDTLTPNTDVATETSSANYRFVTGYYSDAGSAAAKTIGVAGGTSSSVWNIAYIEVKAGAATSKPVPTAYRARTARARLRRAYLFWPAIAAVPTVAEIGNSPVGLAGTGLEVKVAVVTGVGTIGLAGTSAESRIATEVGTGPIGLAGRSTESHLATDVGNGPVGMAGRGTAAKVVPQLGTQPVGMAGRATAVKVDVDRGTGAVGMAGTAVDKKVAVVVGTGAIGMAGRSVDQKNATPVSTGPIGLAGRSAEVKVATPVSRGPVGLAGRGTQAKVAPEIGSSWVGLAGRALESQGAAAVERGTGAVGLAGRSLEVKIAVVTATGSVGLAGRGTGAKVTAQAGRSAVGLAGRALDRKVAAAQARGAVGLAGWNVSGTPVALWFEWTGSSELALTLQGEWTGAVVTPLTYDHVV